MILIAVKAGIAMNNAVSIYTKRMAEGLAGNNEQVSVLLFTQSNLWQRETINGITYINAIRSPKRSKIKLVRGLMYFYWTYWGVWKLIRYLKKNKGLNTLIHISESDQISIFLMKACSLQGVNYYTNIVEHPFRVNKSLIKRITAVLTPTLAQGMICITQGLQQELNSKSSIVVPPTMEHEFLQQPPEAGVATDRFVIGYCGTLTIAKDGLGILMDSIGMLKQDCRDRITLLVIGDSHGKGDLMAKFEKMAVAKGNGLKVQFTGRLDNTEVMTKLAGCQLLVLTRPDNFQNRYGFPSKLPEYLSTGRPVLVSAVSDIPHYLKNGVSAYLLDDLQPNKVAATIEYIMEHYPEAMEVGRRGFEVAKKVFNNQVQGKRVQEFCHLAK